VTTGKQQDAKKSKQSGCWKKCPTLKKRRKEKRYERRIETPFKYVILSEKGWNGSREEGRGG